MTSTVARADAPPDTALPAAPFLTVHLAIGDHYTDVFSLMKSYEGPGFTESVRRVAGSATYVVRNVNGNAVTFDGGRYRYDGIASGANSATVDLQTLCVNKDGKARCSTDASGLSYSKLVWGPIPQTLAPGMHWTYAMTAPWELGPAGIQTNTVVSIDPSNDTVTLERTGSGTGFADGEPERQPTITIAGKSVKCTVATDGPTHWRGYTTFQRGIVVSDALLVDRRIILMPPSGPALHANERMIMLLNTVPGDS